MKIHDVTFGNGQGGDVGWTKDCGQKWDLDFPVVSVSCRYWGDHTCRPYLMLGDKEIASLPDGEYIEGETEAECKYKTEQWVRGRIEKMFGILLQKEGGH